MDCLHCGLHDDMITRKAGGKHFKRRAKEKGSKLFQNHNLFAFQFYFWFYYGILEIPLYAQSYSALCSVCCAFIVVCLFAAIIEAERKARRRGFKSRRRKHMVLREIQPLLLSRTNWSLHESAISFSLQAARCMTSFGYHFPVVYRTSKFSSTRHRKSLPFRET